MLRLLIVIVFISLVIAPSTAQPTNPPITPDNIAQLEEQYMLGRGSISNIAYTPDGEQLLVDTPLGLWRYDAQDLSAEPELLPATGRFLGYYLDGRYMVFLQQPNTRHILDGETESLLYELTLAENNYIQGFSADGQHIIIGYREADILYYRVVELATAQQIGTLQDEAYSESLLTPEGKRFVVPSFHDKNVYWVWDRENHTLSPTFTGIEQLILTNIMFSPDGTRFIVDNFNYPDLYDTATETHIKHIEPYDGFPEMIIDQAFSPDSAYIFAAGYNRGMYHRSQPTFVFDSVTGDYLSVNIPSARHLTFSPDNQYVITSIRREYDLFTTNRWVQIGTWEQVFEVKGRNILSHPNQDQIIVYDNSIQRYEFASQTPLDDVILHQLDIPQTDVFSPDDRFLLTYSKDIYLWDTQTGEFVHRLPVNTDSSSMVFRFSPDGRYLINSTYIGEINIWDVYTGQLLHTVTNYIGDGGELYYLGITGRGYPDPNWYAPYQNPSFSPDGNLFISTLINFLFLRDTQTGELIHQQRISEGDVVVRQAQFNPDGSHIVTIQADETIQWWNSDTWTADVIITDATSPVISPDGRYVAYGVNNEIRLFDTQTGENRLFNDTYRARITYLYFSEDGQHLYSGTEGEISKWWDIETGTFIIADNHLDTHGNRLALISCQVDEIRHYCLINTTTQESIFTFMGHVGSVTYARFNHAGTQIVTTGSDGTIRLWGIGD